MSLYSFYTYLPYCVYYSKIERGKNENHGDSSSSDEGAKGEIKGANPVFLVQARTALYYRL